MFKIALLVCLVTFLGGCKKRTASQEEKPFTKEIPTTTKLKQKTQESSILIPVIADGNQAQLVAEPKETQVRKIILFNKAVTNLVGDADDIIKKHRGVKGHVFSHAVQGFSGYFPVSELAKLKKDPRIKYIAEDRPMKAFSQDIPSGVRRIRSNYNKTAAIAGDGGDVDVDIAIIDTGVDIDHPDLNVFKMVNYAKGSKSGDDGNCGLTNNDPMHTAICAAVAAGVVFVVAAGNENQDSALSTPAAYDEVITVSALADSDGIGGGIGGPTTYGPDDTLASFSNFGADVDIAAPGVDILSTWNDGGVNTISGTSMACPHVAGAAALYIVKNGKPTNAAGVKRGSN